MDFGDYKLRCEKDKDAVFVSTCGHPAAERLLGTVYHLVEIIRFDPIVGPMWSFTGPPRVIVLPDGTTATYDGVADRCLRPLDDQDGPDESLSWKEVPKPEPEISKIVEKTEV